jgi:sporulation protein YlmC with PRC-barrel domain
MAENQAARAEVLRTRDLIGWAVADPAGATVGTVSDVLIGRDGRVRYLAVKRGLLGGSVLLPVDQLEWGEQSMRLTSWLDAEVRRLPGYDGDRALSPAVIAEMERAHPRFYGPPLPFDAPGVEGAARVVPLREAREFRLPKTAPNVRGWNVFGEDHERVGVVEDMLVDPVEMKVRYLDVDLADDLFLLKEDRHVIIPMEAVELRERGEDVWIHGLTAKQIAMLPAYTGGSVDPLVEMRVREAFAGGGANALPPSHAAQAPAVLPPPVHETDSAPPLDERMDAPPLSEQGVDSETRFDDGTLDDLPPREPVDLPPPPHDERGDLLPPDTPRDDLPPPDLRRGDTPPPLPWDR